MCCPLVFEFSVGIGGFVIGLGQISFFFSLFESCLALRIKYSYEEQARTCRINCEMKTIKAGQYGILLLRNGKFVIWKLKPPRLS